MNPQPTFCPNRDCPSRGVEGGGNIRLHDSLRNRWRCRTCRKTFSGRKGTPLYNLKSDPQLFVWVVTLLAFGCPVPAVVAAFGLDERTVADWRQRAGEHCQRVHEARVETPRALRSVQADEVRVRCQRRVLWMAMAVCAPTRLWLGGVVSAHRDKHLARALAERVRACCRRGALLIVTDGWPAYKQAFVRAFRDRALTGRAGRPRLVAWPAFVLAQTVKWVEAGRTLGIRACHRTGDAAGIRRLLPAGQVLATAYIERLNATFRARLAGLGRRTRCLPRTQEALEAGMYLVGTLYNFCTPHRSLEEDDRPRTPAMAAGLTRHIWGVGELLGCHVAPPPYVPPKRRGRKPKSANSLLTT